MRIKHLFIYILAAFIVSGCAKMMPLTGGDRDSEAPKLAKASPDTFATNFNSKEIKLVFNEFITVDDPSRNILFSPALTTEPNIVANPKSITIKLKEELKPNTTYTVRMQSAIKDLNEGNVLEEQIYVFSTGPSLDSGKVVGLLMNYLDNAPIKGAKIGLYPEDATPEFIKNNKPEFWTMTRADGTFEIPFIRKEKFKIFALKEEDNSFIYDRAGESIAFLTEPVHSDSLAVQTMFMFTSTNDSLKLLKHKYRGNGTFSFLFSKPVSDVTFEVKDSVGIVDNKVLINGSDSILVWVPKMERKYADFIIKADKLTDTVNIKFRESAKSGSARGGKGTGTVLPQLVPNASSEMSIYDTLALQFPYPVLLVDSSKIKLSIDSVSRPFTIQENPLNPLQWQLFFNKESNKPYKLEAYKGAFVSYIQNDTIDSLQLNFGFLKVQDYAELELTMTNRPSGTPLIVSLTKDKKIVFSTKLSESDTIVTINNLAPGNYSLSAYVDVDGNGRLSEGDFDKGILPERLYILGNPIIIRRGFNQKVNWDFNQVGRGR